MSDITNAMLAQKISDLLLKWSLREREMQEWLSGASNGGPYADGRYALTDVGGTVAYTKSPARIEQEVSGLVTSATEASGEVLAIHTQVIATRDIVVAARDQTSNYLNQVVAARDMAQQHRGYAANSEQNSLSYRNASQASAAAALADAQTANTKATDAKASADEAAASAAAAAASAEAAALFDPSSYYTREVSDARFAPIAHTHGDTELTSLDWSKLQNVPATFPTGEHAHTPEDVVGLDVLLDAKADAAHGHAIADIVGLVSVLAGKADAAHMHGDTEITALSWSKIVDVPTAFAPAPHTHSNDDIGALAWAKLSDVPSEFVPTAHSHGDADIAGLSWEKITNVPSAFAPSAHTHGDADISGISWSKLADVPAAFPPSGHAHPEYMSSVPDTESDWNSVADGNTHFLASSTNGPSEATYFGMSVGNTLATYAFQLAGRNGVYQARTKENGTWQSWAQLALVGHIHAIADVTGLQAALDGKAAYSHTHSYLPLAGGSLTGALSVAGDTLTSGGFRWSTDANFYLYNTNGYTYGSWRVGGSRGGYVGLVLDDSGRRPTFMSSGTASGIYNQGSSYWAFYDDGTYFRMGRRPYQDYEGGGALLHYTNGYGGGRITVSTSTPSGTPADGDIWIQREA